MGSIWIDSELLGYSNRKDIRPAERLFNSLHFNFTKIRTGGKGGEKGNSINQVSWKLLRNLSMDIQEIEERRERDCPVRFIWHTIFANSLLG